MNNTIQYNALLENLQERVVQETPLKLIYAENLYKAFDKGTEQNFEFRPPPLPHPTVGERGQGRSFFRVSW